MIAATPPVPARVQVAAHEFNFVLSRQTVHAGPAIIELANFGMDPHDLRLQRKGAKHIAGTPLVLAGAHFELKVKLVKGRYTLWCSLADHRARGMVATLVVK